MRVSPRLGWSLGSFGFSDQLKGEVLWCCGIHLVLIKDQREQLAVPDIRQQWSQDVIEQNALNHAPYY